MPRQKGKVPSYCLHKASGRAVVRLNGKDHYLGEYGSDESHQRYQQLIKTWSTVRRGHFEKQAELLRQNDPFITIESAVAFYCHWAPKTCQLGAHQNRPLKGRFADFSKHSMCWRNQHGQSTINGKNQIY